MNLVLLGAPGSGKGTQGRRIAARLGVPQLSTGDMLRGAVAAGSPVGKTAKAVMERGELVSDDIVSGVVAERLDAPDTAPGAVFDGYPRTRPQAVDLDRLLQARRRRVNCALEIDVDDSLLAERITGRYTCTACGEGYHDRFKQPAVAGRCDACGGGSFARRADDNVETVRQRLAAYHAETAPLVDFYRAAGKLRRVDGGRSIAEVRERIDAVLALPAAETGA